MTGFGRTGRRFAMDHFGIAPDIIAAGKGISSGYAPLGAIIAQRHVVDAIANGSGMLLHGFTYNGHPVSVATGHAVLKRLLDGQLIEAADAERPGSMARVLGDELQEVWKLDCVGDVRGLGLLWAVEFVADKQSKEPYPAQKKFAARVSECAVKRGVMLYPMQGCMDGKRGDHVMIAPPAMITVEEIRWAVAQLAEAIAEASRG
jgi:adenosylmethionine-8-amino-7-oxononanoate aminotransferase